MRIEHLRQRLADLGAKPVHVQRMLRAWTHALGGNALLEEILDRGLPYLSGPQWLAENVLKGR
ncbi:hypothetical protein, partial [Zoogloea sp.]|uniref:hypothetical protein n=1 Tax=Zoogloea sp. TaxID=49181 RepID=UPI001AC0B57D